MSALVSELRSWDWTFGRTPKFSVGMLLQLSGRHRAECQLEVRNGLVASCRVLVPPNWISQSRVDQLSRALVGQRFCRHAAATAVHDALLPLDDTGGRLEELGEELLKAMGGI